MKKIAERVSRNVFGVIRRSHCRPKKASQVQFPSFFPFLPSGFSPPNPLSTIHLSFSVILTVLCGTWALVYDPALGPPDAVLTKFLFSVTARTVSWRRRRPWKLGGWRRSWPAAPTRRSLTRFRGSEPDLSISEQRNTSKYWKHGKLYSSESSGHQKLRDSWRCS